MRDEAFFKQAFAASPVAMLAVDTKGVIVEVNHQLENLFGYLRSELVGAPVETLIDAELATSHQRLRQTFLKDPHARPMGAGRELFARHRDGARIPVEIGLTPVGSPESILVLASIVDLSERRRADERFRLAIEAAPNGMMLVDEQGRIALVNAQVEQVFGYSRSELIGHPVEMLLPVAEHARHVGSRSAFFAAPRARPMGNREVFGVRKGGDLVPLEIGLSPLVTPSGRFVLSSIVDITERKRSHEQVRNSLVEKEMLLREVHHRAKNNLQLVISLLDLASSRPETDATQVLAECRDRVGAIALVHELLYQTSTSAHIRLAEYLTVLGEQLRNAWAAEDGVSLGIQCDDIALPLERAIPCGLIVNELATNAFKHAFPMRGGSIGITAKTTGANRVTITVTDDGVGMPAETRPGSLGLELIRALTRQLKAEVQFESKQGTTVSVSFEVSP